MAFLTNRHALETHTEAFSIFTVELPKVRKVTRSETAPILVELDPALPAVVMDPRHALPHEALTKRDFQSLHNGKATPDLTASVLNAFGSPNLETFKNKFRTIGCGQEVYFHCDDGVFQALVQRTAPPATPDGVVHPGTFTRPAGSAIGDLQETQIRETTEEMNVFIDRGNGTLISVNLLRMDHAVSDEFMQRILAEKNRHLREIFSQVAHRATSGAASQIIERTFQAFPMHINGLHETIVQKIGTSEKTFKAIVNDDPKNGDLGCVDEIIVIPMPGVKSSQLLIADGERNQKGELLNRDWFILRPADILNNMADKSMVLSPNAAIVMPSTSKIMDKITTEFTI